MDDKPVFFDASGRRRRRFAAAIVAFVLLLVLAAAVFLGSIVAVVPQPPLPFEVERAQMTGVNAPERKLANEGGRKLRHMVAT